MIGPPGPPGSPGREGFPGAKGSQGVKGIQGLPGPKQNGTVRGPKGSNGERGPRGPPGANGRYSRCYKPRYLKIPAGDKPLQPGDVSRNYGCSNRRLHAAPFFSPFVIERLGRARCATARETGVSKVDGCAENGEVGCASRSLQSLLWTRKERDCVQSILTATVQCKKCPQNLLKHSMLGNRVIPLKM